MILDAQSRAHKASASEEHLIFVANVSFLLAIIPILKDTVRFAYLQSARAEQETSLQMLLFLSSEIY